MKASLARPFVVTLSLGLGASVGAAACKSSSDDKPPPSGGGSGTVNPPELGCPPSKPQEGSPCTVTGQSCAFADPTFGCPDPETSGTVTCETGLWKWLAPLAPCAPPGPGCPPAATAKGFTCPGDASTGQCVYPGCAADASIVYTCVGGHLAPSSPPASCGDGGLDAGDASDAAQE